MVFASGFSGVVDLRLCRWHRHLRRVDRDCDEQGRQGMLDMNSHHSFNFIILFLIFLGESIVEDSHPSVWSYSESATPWPVRPCYPAQPIYLR
jgi:hypothetical protein